MKYHRYFLITLLALGFFFACTKVPTEFVNEQIAEKARHSTVRLITAEPIRQIKFDDESSDTIMYPDGGLGSGFFVDHDKIATNIHCVAGKTKIRAKLVGDETFYDIKEVIAWDPENDLVILKVASKGPKPLSLGDSDAVQMKEPIATIGNPKGGIEGQITYGKVYNRRRSDKWFRLTVELHPGNSGGPILGSKGVIGIAVQKESSAYGSFISRAIPSNTLVELLKKTETAKPLDLEKWQRKEPILAYDYYSLASNIFRESKRESAPENQHIFYKKAIKLIDKAIERYKSPKFYLLRGRVYEELGRYQEAIDDYTESISRKSDDATAHVNRGTVKWKRHRYEEAITDFEKVVELIPVYTYSYMIMGDSKLKLKRYEEAINDFGKVIKLIPTNANAYYNRGVARGEWGEFEEARGKSEAAKTQFRAAIRNLKKTLELAPNHAEAIHNRAIHNLKTYEKRISDIDDKQ